MKTFYKSICRTHIQASFSYCSSLDALAFALGFLKAVLAILSCVLQDMLEFAYHVNSKMGKAKTKRVLSETSIESNLEPFSLLLKLTEAVLPNFPFIFFLSLCLSSLSFSFFSSSSFLYIHFFPPSSLAEISSYVYGETEVTKLTICEARRRELWSNETMIAG